MKSKIFWVIVIIGALIAVLWHQDKALKKEFFEEPLEGKVAKEGVDLEQKVLSFTIDGRSPKGAKQWHLEGASADIMDDEIHLNELRAVAYGDDTVINLKSDSGIYRKEKGEVELIGNVEVTSDDGFTLITERASWSQLTKDITTDEVVYINREGMSAVGTGGQANSDNRTATLKKDVTVSIEPDTEVNCNGRLDVDYNGNVAIFYDNVKVKDKDGNLIADKLTVDFDPDTQQLARVTAEGNVKLKRGKSYTISEKAIYTESTKSAKLVGRPRVIIDPEEMEGLETFPGSGDTEENS